MPSQFTADSGAAFDDQDVARCYACRPPYAPTLFDALLTLVPNRRRALDLGCGPGKLAAVLSGHFDEVIALDPSAPMLAQGRAHCPAANILWFHGRDTDAPLEQAFDLVVAGTSIHFMDHAQLFPRLAECTPLFATVAGDHPPSPPWADEWSDAMDTWLRRVGRTPDPAGFFEFGRRYEAWVDIAGRRDFNFVFTQPLEDFITGQHSRATWSRAIMGANLADEFDRDLERRLRPWAPNGLLTFDMTSELVWGAPRRTARL